MGDKKKQEDQKEQKDQEGKIDVNKKYKLIGKRLSQSEIDNIVKQYKEKKFKKEDEEKEEKS